MRAASIPTRVPRARRRSRGFSLIELIVVVAIVGVLALITVPPFLEMLVRSRMMGTANNVMSFLNRARGEAVKNGVPVVVAINHVTQELEAFVDVNDGAGQPNADLRYNPLPPAQRPFGATDYLLPSYSLPAFDAAGTRRSGGIFFWDAGEMDPILTGASAALSGFVANPNPGTDYSTRIIVYDPSGSVRGTGLLVLGRGPFGVAADPGGKNFLAISVTVGATGKMELLKWIPGDTYRPKLATATGTNWNWYR